MTVTELFIYPVKSLSGVSVNQAELTERGFLLDRRWMLVDDKGQFFSQRNLPAMALIEVGIEEQSLHFKSPEDTNGVRVPLVPLQGQPAIKVKVWDSVCYAIGGYEEANIWFSKQLSIDCRLVYMPEQTKRLVNSDLVPQGSIVSFADGYPYLIVGTASLDDLNHKLEESVSISRFRPNIVVQTKTPFEEDTWKQIQIGEAAFMGVKPCSRCIMVNVNPQTSLSYKEPLKTLSTYRKIGNKVKFGLNSLWIEAKTGLQSVKVGDEVKLENEKKYSISNRH